MTWPGESRFDGDAALEGWVMRAATDTLPERVCRLDGLSFLALVVGVVRDALERTPGMTDWRGSVVRLNALPADPATGWTPAVLAAVWAVGRASGAPAAVLAPLRAAGERTSGPISREAFIAALRVTDFRWTGGDVYQLPEGAVMPSLGVPLARAGAQPSRGGWLCTTLAELHERARQEEQRGSTGAAILFLVLAVGAATGIAVAQDRAARRRRRKLRLAGE